MKVKSQFVCQQCGASYTKWVGQCTNCQAWNSLVEQVIESESGKKTVIERGRASGKKLDFVKIKTITPSDSKARLLTEFNDLNTVLGGGILLGSVSLLAGQPGIGKSTLLMQISAEVAKTRNVLYVSGEETKEQVKLRADRLNIDNENLLFMGETDIDNIENEIINLQPVLVIVDSIQTMYSSEITSAPGTVSQVRAKARIILLSSAWKTTP